MLIFGQQFTKDTVANVYPPSPTHKNVATQYMYVVAISTNTFLFLQRNNTIQPVQYTVIVQLLMTVKTRQRQAENMPSSVAYISTEKMESPQEA